MAAESARRDVDCGWVGERGCDASWSPSTPIVDIRCAARPSLPRRLTPCGIVEQSANGPRPGTPRRSLLRHHRHRPGARPGRHRRRSASARPGSWSAARCSLSSRWTPARDGRAWAPRPCAAAVAGVAVYQLAFFAAVADTGVAVGTIVALGSAPTLTGLFEWIVDGRRPSAAGPSRPRSPAPASRCSRWRAATPTCRRPASRSPSSPAARMRLHARRQAAAGRRPRARDGDGGRVRARRARAGARARRQRPGWLGHAGGIALALFLGIVPTALAYLLFAHGLKRLTASETATLTLAEPLTAGGAGRRRARRASWARAVAGAGSCSAAARARRPPPDRPRHGPRAGAA